jgi:hypothetical protein
MRRKPDDEEIGLAFSNKETDDGIDFVSFKELRREFDPFALRRRWLVSTRSR